MKRILVILLGVLPLAASCEKEIAYPIKGGDRSLLVECIASNGTDTTFISVQPTYPIGGGREGAVHGLSAAMSVNGKERDVELVSKDGEICVFGVPGQLGEGDAVRVDAWADGIARVSTSGVVPAALQLDCERSLEDDNLIRYRMVVRRPDDGASRHCYAVLLRSISIAEEAMWYSGVREYTCDTLEQRVSYFNVVAEQPYTLCTLEGRPAMLFEADENSPSMEIVFDAGYDEDCVYAATPTDTSIVRYMYDVQLLNVPPLLYDYYNPPVSDVLLGAGLVPPFVNFSNIDGGYGILACAGRSSTGWTPGFDPLPPLGQ